HFAIIQETAADVTSRNGGNTGNRAPVRLSFTSRFGRSFSEVTPMKQLVIASAVFVASVGALRADVTFVRTPAGGIQPQAVMDGKGNLHLLYFRGDPKAGNLMYVRKDAGKDDFSDPIKVNSQEGSAIAVGTIRGGHIPGGKNGRVHVA